MKKLFIILFVLLILGIAVFFFHRDKTPNPVLVGDNPDNKGFSTKTTPVKEAKSLNDTEGALVQVSTSSDVSPINPLTAYSSYNIKMYNVYLPSYPIGILIDQQGASNYIKMKDNNGNFVFVEKSKVEY